MIKRSQAEKTFSQFQRNLYIGSNLILFVGMHLGEGYYCYRFNKSHNKNPSYRNFYPISVFLKSSLSCKLNKETNMFAEFITSNFDEFVKKVNFLGNENEQVENTERTLFISEENERRKTKKLAPLITRPSLFSELAIIQDVTMPFYIVPSMGMPFAEHTAGIIGLCKNEFQKKLLSSINSKNVFNYIDSLVNLEVKNKFIADTIARTKFDKGLKEENSDDLIEEVVIKNTKIQVTERDWNQFEEARKLFLQKNLGLPLTERIRVPQLLELSEAKLIDGRLLKTTCSFEKALRFVNLLLEDETSASLRAIFDVLEGIQFFEKDTGMFFIEKFFGFIDKTKKQYKSLEKKTSESIEINGISYENFDDALDRQYRELKEIKGFNEFKKILAMDLLYGVYPDDCNKGVGALAEYFQNSQPNSFLIEHDVVSNGFSALTFLEIVYLRIKNRLKNSENNKNTKNEKLSQLILALE